ncbi:MAG: ABC transporter ATP-binding protein [Gammaproteobacteria bacterium]
MSDLSIKVEGIGKYYELGANTASLARGLVGGLRRLRRGQLPLPRRAAQRAEKPGMWVLRDVSFEVRKGDVLGIIGRNGAGKTTLLKILSRVAVPTEGRAEIHGRVSSLLGVGTGFHNAFTGRENVFLSGMLLGLERAEIERRFDDIEAVAEIGSFIDTPVKYYSSGMRARLAFSVAVQLASEIMMLDEVLAVGDAGFRKKCLEVMRNLRSSDRSVLLVSHSLGYIQEYCNRCILLEKGRIVMDGPPDEVCDYYLHHMFPVTERSSLKDLVEREGDGRIRATELYLEDFQGRRLHQPVSGEDCVLCIAFETHTEAPLRDVDIGLAICDQHGHWITRLSTYVNDAVFEQIDGGGVFKCRVSRMPLTAGDYGVGLRITSQGDVLDYIINAGRFTIYEGDFFGTGRLETHSPVLLMHDWLWERAEA